MDEVTNELDKAAGSGEYGAGQETAAMLAGHDTSSLFSSTCMCAHSAPVYPCTLAVFSSLAHTGFLFSSTV